jgi:hypothetical protein
LQAQPLLASSITRLRNTLVSIASPPTGVLTYFDGSEQVLRDAQFS